MLSFFSASAQENSPYSRYGIGDLYPSQNIINRGMGGLTAAYTDPVGQSINFSNPASYGDFRRIQDVGGVVLYDFGLSIDSRTLRSKSPVKKYSSANFIPSYLALGVPISKGLGAAIGIKPYSRINYSIIDRTRLPTVDSAEYLYEGNGGLNQAFIGLGKRWKTFSIGFNTGYMFGRKENNTRLQIINTNVTDTGYVPSYTKSLSGTTTSFGKLFFSVGILYDINIKTIKAVEGKKPQQNYGIRLGTTAMLKQTFNASQDLTRETFEYNASGGTVTIDSIYKTTGTKVVIQVPATYNVGIMFHKSYSGPSGSFDAWMVGAELETAKWSQFRYDGQSDKLSDYWQCRLGGQFLPSTSSTALLGRSTYRFGVAFGRDYINADNNGLKTFFGTFGMGIPVKPRSSYNSQFTNINLALEVGKRGTGINNITENYFRFSVGLSLSDIWFHKRKYD